MTCATRIVEVLKSHRITALNEQDQQKAVPWRRAGEQAH